jgi:glyoxylase-like metal-dependent hydrolase (beta-lactamase superfamily II)
MNIQKFTLGMYKSNCYIVYENGQAIVIDPGYESDQVINCIDQNKLNVLAIYATHGHIDHVGGIKQIKDRYQAKVYAPLKDKIWFIDSNYNRLGYEIPVDTYIEDRFVLNLEDRTFTVIETPGHSEGGTILCDLDHDLCFSGDTLFFETIGRTDLPFSSFDDIVKSIKKMYQLLPNQTKLYPGHGRPTTIGHEKIYNMFVKEK